MVPLCVSDSDPVSAVIYFVGASKIQHHTLLYNVFLLLFSFIKNVTPVLRHLLVPSVLLDN